MNKHKIVFLFIYMLSAKVHAQFLSGFNINEAKDLIAICNSYTFLDLYKSDSAIIPPGYIKTYTSPVLGMDNIFQIYRNEKFAVINLRGSTDKKISWLENINSAMIPAKGTILRNNEKFEYCFAFDTNAAVHSGYALAISYLSKEIVTQINRLNMDGVYHIIITGHSQGGALTNMLRAYLENLHDFEISTKNKFKSYSFAAPMIGNKSFITEYNFRFCKNNTSFNIVNPEDPIPYFPISYNDTNYVSDNLQAMLFEKESFSIKKMFSDAGIILFKSPIGMFVNNLSGSTSKQIGKDLGTVVFPPFVKGFNYQKTGNRIEIPSAIYPKILKDSSMLQNDSLIALLSKDSNGNFVDDKLYRKEPWSFQHKTYNYYVSVLKIYFPEQYAALKKKFLTENL